VVPPPNTSTTHIKFSTLPTTTLARVRKIVFDLLKMDGEPQDLVLKYDGIPVQDDDDVESLGVVEGTFFYASVKGAPETERHVLEVDDDDYDYGTVPSVAGIGGGMSTVGDSIEIAFRLGSERTTLCCGRVGPVRERKTQKSGLFFPFFFFFFFLNY
jgi:hypothetical protein